MAITGQRPLAYNEQSGQEEEVFFPANSILFDDGYSFQQKFDSGELRGQIGPQGAQGEQGIQGVQGPIGPAASITLRVKKNEAGGLPTVEQSGDAQSGYTITLGIPSGLKGDTGDKGDNGVTPVIDTAVDVTTAPAGSPASASLTKNGSNYHLNLVIPQGEQGQSGTGGATVFVDDIVSDTSTNPVRNSVIKAYVDKAIASLVDNAPEALNTLKKLSAALRDDYDYASTVTRNLSTKVDKEEGKGLSDRNFTQEEKTKLSGIETGAQVNTVIDIKGVSNDSGRTGHVIISADDVGAAYKNHGHSASDIPMTDYEIKQGTISYSDNVLSAIGKLENKVNSKQDAGDFAANNHDHESSEIHLNGFVAREESNTDTITSDDNVMVALAKLQARIEYLTNNAVFVDK